MPSHFCISLTRLRGEGASDALEPRFDFVSGTLMKIFGALTLLSLTLVPLSAHAETRGTDAALGAVSGAVVFGPVGAVAGAVVGFTAGPAISNSWGVKRNARSRYRARTRSPQMESRAAPGQPAPGNATAGQAGPASGPAASASDPAASAQARMPASPAAAPAKAPPVQGLE
jgi:hypothetical protein